MRRGIFVLLCLVLAVSMAAIPADTISARSASSLELSAPSPAQLEKEKDQVDKIVDELKLARGYTDDKKIRGQIDDISNMIKTAWKYEKAGDTELALAMKVKAAKFLEDLIGELPAASPGMTTAAAAMPEENPLYEELVRVWGKIIVLIDMELERVPEGVTPLIPEIQRVTEPEIKRPPEMERLIVYSAKFLCGPAFGGEGVQPGSYSTAINVHNPYNQTVYLYKKAVIAEPEYKPRGQISAFRKVVLRADEAIEIDCLDIGSFFRPQPEPRKPTEEGRPSLTLTPTYAENMVGEHHKLVATVRDANGNPVAGAEVSFHLLETGSTPVRPTDGNGQALLEYSSPEEHKDTIVATVTVNGHKLEAQATKVWTSKPTEEAQCPQGCECMTETQASVDNLALCQNQRIQCGSAVSTTTTATAATTVPMYCYEKPPQEVGCPQGCFCTDPGKADEEGLEWCLRNGDEIPCGGNQYCFREPTGQPTSECPAGCECLTEDALQQGYTWCEGVRRQCGYDEYQNDMFCFQKPSGTSRLTNVAMAMPEETGLTAPSEQTGTTLSTSGLPIRELYRPTRFIKGFVVIYSTAPLDVVGVYTASTAFGFSLDVEYLQPSTRGVPPILIPDEPEEEVCPQGCVCLTEDDADKRYGPNATMCQDELCGYDAQRNVDKYCWKPAEEGRPSLTLKPSYDENMVGENHTVTAIVTKNGSPVPGVDVQFQLVEPDSVHSDKLGMLTKTTDAAGQATGFNYSGDKEGKDTIVASATVDGYELKAQATKVWTSKPTEEAECPQRCECRTEAEAEEYDYTFCLDDQGRKIVCEYDERQNPTKYCFRKPTEEAEPARITLTPTQARNKVCTYHKVVATVYDASGSRLAGQKVYFHVDGANTGAGSPSGADFEATTDANGQAVFSYHGENPGEDKITAMAGSTGPVAGAFKTWYAEAVEHPRPARISLTPTQARNEVCTYHKVVASVYDSAGKPLAGEAVYFKVFGANSASGQTTTDANGQATFSYHGETAGEDTITAMTGNQMMATAYKSWYIEVKRLK